MASGCAVPNPMFDDNGSGGQDGGGATASSPTVSGSSSGRASSPTASSTEAPTSGDSVTTGRPTSSGTSSSGEGPTEGADTSTGEPANPWWDTDYGMRVSLKFSQRLEPLPGFCAFVDLNLEDGVFADTERTQFVFVEVDTGMRLASEAVHVTASGGRLRAWVRLPIWGHRGPTAVDLYWDPEAPAAEPLSPWSSDYVGVWHMDTITDAAEVVNSAGGRPLVGVGTSSATDLAGVTYRALRFDGETDRLSADLDGLELEPYFTAYAWANLGSFAQNGAPLFARGGRVGPEPVNTEWLLRFYAESTHARLHADGGAAQEFSGGAADIGQWHHYALQANATEWVLFVDGQRLATSDADYNGVLDHELSLFSVGGYGHAEEVNWSSRLFDGMIDEVAWRQGGDLSDVWIETLFDNQGDPSSTYDVGSLDLLRR